jgi:addiction module RelE/StbE family toxin
MKVRWSPEAADDLERIYQYIFEDSPLRASEVVRTVYDGIIALKTFPNRGRPGRERGTRELVFTSLPYIAVYRVAGEIVEISRIWHGAQEWKL